MTDEANILDLNFFRRIVLIGAVLLIGISIMNATISTDIVDFPFPRLLIAGLCVLLGIASYSNSYIQKNCLLILYALLIAFMMESVYISVLNHFPIYDTSSSIIVFFALGALFRSKRFLLIYLVILLVTFSLASFFCASPKIDTTYLMTSMGLTVVLSYVVFSGKINAIQGLKESQEKLQESEERFRSVFEQSPTGILLLNKNLEIIDANIASEQLFATSETQLLNKSIVNFIKENDTFNGHLLNEKINQTNKIPINFEVELQTKHSKPTWVQMIIAEIKRKGIKEENFLVILENITFQKESKITLENYSTQLKEHNRALMDFSYVISHDLQEPLRMIKSYTQLIKRRYISQIENKDAHIDMNFVIDGAERMSNLIKDMLSYSRWSAKPFEKQDVDAHEILVDVIKNLAITIQDTEAEIYAYDMPKVLSNDLVLGQVLQNLIGNGIKYSQKGRNPVITICAEDRIQDHLFTVKDNGQGFEEKDSERIFGIFQRLHGRDSQYTGTGIGLAICKRIIERQGGQIWAEGEVEKGATFYFTLPKNSLN